MKTHQVSLINAILLIILPIWGYLESASPSFTAFIPAVIGLIILALNKGIKNENKVLAHIAVLLTFIVLFGLFKPMSGAMARGDQMAVIRVGLMIASTVLALIYFIKSFIDARRNKS